MGTAIFVFSINSLTDIQLHSIKYIDFFPAHKIFAKKAVKMVKSEKNILNSSVEWSRWSGFF